MNNLHAIVKIEDTGELVHVEGDSVSEMLYQIRQTVGDYVNVTIHTLAVLSLLLMFVSDTSHASDIHCSQNQQGVWRCYEIETSVDIHTAGQTSAPLCVNVDCIEVAK